MACGAWRRWSCIDANNFASAPLTEVRVDTDAGWKTLTLISRQGGRYTFRAAMGQPERVAEEQIEAAGETLTVTTLAIGNPQCVALVKALPEPPRFERLGPALATHKRFATAPTSNLPSSKRLIASGSLFGSVE